MRPVLSRKVPDRDVPCSGIRRQRPLHRRRKLTTSSTTSTAIFASMSRRAAAAAAASPAAAVSAGSMRLSARRAGPPCALAAEAPRRTQTQGAWCVSRRCRRSSPARRLVRSAARRRGAADCRSRRLPASAASATTCAVSPSESGAVAGEAGWGRRHAGATAGRSCLGRPAPCGSAASAAAAPRL